MKYLRQFLCSLVFAGIAFSQSPIVAKTINVTDFGVKPDSGQDATLGVFQALEACRAVKNPVLVFPKGTYHFYPDKACERYYSIANNWHRLQRVALPLWGFKGLTVDGQGSDFILHGLIMPVVIDDSKQMTLKNFAIDWQRPSFSQGEVIASDATHFDLRIPKEYPYKLVHGELVFTEGATEYPLRDFLEFDPKTKATAFQVDDAAGGGKPTTIEDLGSGVVRFTFKKQMRTPPTLGNVVVLRGGNHRDTPAIFCIHSKDIVSENVNIYTSSGMGFIAQRCENLTLRKTNVRVREGSDRLFTCDADATHFVYCRGQILLEDCLFENQLDDAGNVHGIYSRVEEKLDDHTLLMRLVHPEQVGVEVAAPGEHIRLVDNKTIHAYANLTVSAVKRLSIEYFTLTVRESLPTEVKPLHVLENLDWQPDLTIRNCTTRRNRARGFLIGTSGKVVVENNKMEEPGACLLMGIDANYWFESGPVKNVLIRNNQFINPNYGVWGKRALEFGSASGLQEPYERNITIESNVFKLFNLGVLNAESIDGLRFVSNTLERTTDFPRTQQAPMPAVSIRGCRNVEISGNRCTDIAEDESLITLDGQTVGHLGADQSLKK